MTFGVSAFAWTSSIGLKHLPLFPQIRDFGFSTFEIAMFDPRDLPIAALRRAYAANDLECTVCSILPPGINPINPDAAIRKRSQEHLVACVETAAELGATLIGGPMYAPIGYLPGHRPTHDERQWAVEAFQSLGPLLDKTGITLSFEPVNRSETFFLRTAAESVALVEAIGHPRVGVTVDTFHANIEEKNIPAAILALGTRLTHIHASENDRGLLGTGQVDFAQIMDALKQIDYNRCVLIEGFGFSQDEPNSAGALWADITVTPEDVARLGLQYLQKLH